MKTSLLFLLLLMPALFNADAQSRKLNGVYAGIQTGLSVTIGGGMTRSDNTYLFRPDGTFNHLMHKPDWKTRVTGHYEINGENITLHYTYDNSISRFKFAEGGENINAGGYTLLHMAGDNSVPVGVLKFTSASGSGGAGSGLAYVGTSSNANLYFDGHGHFSNNRSAATVVSGSNVGGGTSNKSGGSGTYQISGGELKLTYDNGRTETHSFFWRPNDKPTMAVIDGNIYFMDDGPNDKHVNAGRPHINTGASAPATNTSATPNTATTAANDVADGKTILLKANAEHGGASLDNIHTVSASATLQGIKVNSYIDVANNRIRLEAHQNGKLLFVEQLEGQGGWRWQNGQTSDLPAARAAEMRTTFDGSVMGLRKQVINRMEIVKTQKVNGNYVIISKLDGNGYIFMLNPQNQLMGSGNQSGATTSTSVLSDMRKINGVLIPFHEVETTGSRKVDILYDDFQINQPLPETVWSKPTGS